MIVGVINMPGRKAYKGQSIKTRFFALGIPLFPTSTIYKVSQNLGIEIPMTGKDIYHAYAKVHFGLLGIAGLMFGSNMRGSESTTKIFLIIVSLGLLAASLKSWISNGEVKAEEAERRRIFSAASLYNMSPEELPFRVQQSLFRELLKIYVGKFSTVEWQQDILKGNIHKDNAALLYTMSYYQNTMTPAAANANMVKTVEDRIQQLKKGKTRVSDNSRSSSSTSSTQSTSSNQSSATTPPIHTVPPMATGFTASPPPTPKTKPQDQTTTPRANPSTSLPDSSSMNAKDRLKIIEAKEKMNGQLGLVGAMIFFAFVAVAFISGGGGMTMFYTFLGVFIVFALITASVFLIPYRNINKDLKNKEKIKVTVRVVDMQVEGGTAYLVVQANKYNIKTLTASKKYGTTALLNKDLEIYIGKESHTLLEILKVSY